MHITTLGDSKHDTFLILPEGNVLCEKKTSSCTLCFSYGRKIPVGAHLVQFGGTAPNVAIGAHHLGHESAVLTTVGEDSDGKRAVEWMQEQGVDTRYIEQRRNVTLTYATILSLNGESTQLVSHTDIAHTLPKQLPQTDILHVAEMGSSYEKVYRDLLQRKKKQHFLLSSNPGSLQIKEQKRALFSLLSASDILFVNTQEAQELLRHTTSSIKTLLRGLQNLGPKTIVLTDGTRGAYARQKTSMYMAPCFPGVRKEATGAGDAFTSGFLAASLQGKTVSEALAWGSVNAASVIGYIGPTAGLLSKTAIVKRLQESTYRVKKLLDI